VRAAKSAQESRSDNRFFLRMVGLAVLWALCKALFR